MFRILVVIAVAALSLAEAAPAQTAPGGAPPHLALVNINTAMPHQLAALPGIGSREIEAIIKGRPYKQKDDLVRRNVIPSDVYQGLKDRIISD
jgi:DNA uptake protein ComE-like DNA-binding protein